MTAPGHGYREWVAGWHDAEADDDHHTGPRPHADWPADRERGYRDYWTSPGGHEKHMVRDDHRQYAGAALQPDPPIGQREAGL